MEAILGSFALVALSEMGDKTQLLALSLAARYRAPWPIMAGIFVATLLNHGLASTLGAWAATQIPAHVLKLALTVLFVGFGLWTLKPDKLDEQKESRLGPFFSACALFFLAEMGDKTQLATVALAARYGSAVLVTTGTTLGMMVTDGLAVCLGDKLGNKVQHPAVRWSAAALFIGFGIASLIAAIRSWP